VADWRIDLQARGHNQDRQDDENGWQVVQTQEGTTAFPPGDTTVSGNFSHQPADDIDRLRAEFSIVSPDDCHAKKKSNQIEPCEEVQQLQTAPVFSGGPTGGLDLGSS